MAPTRELILALPKGRVQEEAVALFGRAGIDLGVTLGDTRRLRHQTSGLSVVVVRSQDVTTYVEHGAADLGIAGRDVLEEERPNVYEPLDLKLGACRLVVAEPQHRRVDERGLVHIRVATKYPNLVRRYLETRGLFAEIIKLYGSVELAPLLGLADRIVDLVSSGETLRQNGLVEVDTLFPVTSRLIVNEASLKLKSAQVEGLIRRLRKVLPV